MRMPANIGFIMAIWAIIWAISSGTAGLSDFGLSPPFFLSASALVMVRDGAAPA
jgi:hypothetical protein